jgi:beta-N-acetylhexosaminidase
LTTGRGGEALPVVHQQTKHSSSLLLVILCDSVRSEDGRVLARQIRERAPDARVIYVDPRVEVARAGAVLRAADRAQQIVVAVYVVPSAARMRTVARGQKHSASLPDSTSNLLNGILARASEKTVVLAMGTPYLTEDFPTIENYICTFSNARVSEISAAKALFGEIPIRGHLPVTLTSATATEPRPVRPALAANAPSRP